MDLMRYDIVQVKIIVILPKIALAAIVYLLNI